MQTSDPDLQPLDSDLEPFNPKGSVATAFPDAPSLENTRKTLVNLFSEKQPTFQNPVAEQALQAMPGIGPIASLSEYPKFRAFMTQQAGMALGTELGGPVGFQIGNISSGALNDVEDHPELAAKAFGILFNTGSAGSLFQQYQKDPEGTLATMKNTLLNAGIRAGTGLVAQLMSFGLSSVVGSMANFKNAGDTQVPGEIPGAKNLLENRGVKTDPSMYSTNKAFKIMKSLMNRTSFGVGRIAENTETLNNYTGDLTSKMSGGLTDEIPTSDLVKMISGAKDLGDHLQNIGENSLYSKLDDIASSKTTNIGEAGIGLESENRFTGINNVKGTFVPTAPIQGAFDGLSPAGQTGRLASIISRMQDRGRFMSFMDMHSFRSDIGRIAESVEDSNPTEAGAAKTLYGSISETMKNAAINAGSDVYNAWKNADNFTKDGKQIFGDDLVSKLFIRDNTLPTRLGEKLSTNLDPDQIDRLQSIFQRTEDLTTKYANTPEFQELLDGPNGADILKTIESGNYTVKNQTNLLKRGILNTLFKNYTDINKSPSELNQTNINYAGILGELNEKTNKDQVVAMSKLWSPQQIGDLRNTMNSGMLAIQNNPATFSRAMFWAERVTGAAIGAGVGTALGHPLLGATAGEAASFIGTGKLMSYLLTDEDAAPVFMRGMKAIAMDTPESAKIGSELVVRSAKIFADNYVKDKYLQNER